MTDEAHQGDRDDGDLHEGTPELVMDELRELRNKQDRQLDGLRRLVLCQVTFARVPRALRPGKTAESRHSQPDERLLTEH